VPRTRRRPRRPRRRRQRGGIRGPHAAVSYRGAVSPEPVHNNNINTLSCARCRGPRNPRRCSPRVPSVVPCYLHFPFMTFFSSFLQHPSPTFLSYIQSERYHPCDRVPTLERPHLCNTRKPPYLFLPTKMPQRALPPPSSRPPRRGAPGRVGAEPSPDRTIDHAHAI